MENPNGIPVFLVYFDSIVAIEAIGRAADKRPFSVSLSLSLCVEEASDRTQCQQGAAGNVRSCHAAESN